MTLSRLHRLPWWVEFRALFFTPKLSLSADSSQSEDREGHSLLFFLFAFQRSQNADVADCTPQKLYGGYRDRTGDIQLAKLALSQLS